MTNLGLTLQHLAMPLVGIALLNITLLVHEAGHAIALLRRGYKVEELGLGIPLAEFRSSEPSPERLAELAWRRENLPTYYKIKDRIAALCAPRLSRVSAWLRAHTPAFLSRLASKMPAGPIVRIRSKRLPFDLTLSPLLIGAYVKHETDGLRNASYKDKAVVFGAGVVMNLLFAELIGLGYYVYTYIANPNPVAAMFIGTFLLLLGLTYFGRRLIAMAAPFIGLLYLGLVVWLLTTASSAGGDSGGAGGPIYVVGYSASGHSWSEVLFIAAIISACLAFTNMIPLFPLDGGHTMIAALKKLRLGHFVPAYTSGTRFSFLVMFAFLMFGDVRRLLFG